MRLAYCSRLARPVPFMKTVCLRKVALRILVFTAAFLLPMSAELAGAQDIFGRISGTVTDPTGAGVPNVKVTITNQETNLARTVKADAHGFYVAQELPVGTYKVTAEEKGFKTVIKTGNELVAGGHLTVDLTLQIGEVSQKVEVTAVGETVNTISGEISRTIDSQQVEHMALNERNYGQLVSLIPGAVLTGFDQTALTTGM